MMATPPEPNKGNRESGAESPTTARPFEIDSDDDVQETGLVPVEDTNKAPSPTGPVTARSPPPVATVTTDDEEAPPVKPPRPVSEAQKNEAILKEAFPAVDLTVIKAVLRASGGQVEPAFNALLEMTDPDAAKNEPEEVAPPQPPRPQGRAQQSQLEADEQYARQLAQHYDNVGAYEQRTSSQRGQRPDARPQARNRAFDDDDDKEHSFMDDDLPVIRENLRKGFLETQTTVNSWINTLKKRIEDNFDETDNKDGQYGQYGRQGEASRRSGDYDADPQVLSDDFAGMKFTTDGTPAHRASPMNQGVYRPPSTSPRPGAKGRHVGFKEETEEIDMYDSSPRVPPKDSAPNSGRASKWQPLSSVEPSPITDNDPFSLGDSEDEREAKEAKETTKDQPKDTTGSQIDNERLQQATADAMAESLVDKTKTNDSSVKRV